MITILRSLADYVAWFSSSNDLKLCLTFPSFCPLRRADILKVSFQSEKSPYFTSGDTKNPNVLSLSTWSMKLVSSIFFTAFSFSFPLKSRSWHCSHDHQWSQIFYFMRTHLLLSRMCPTIYSNLARRRLHSSSFYLQMKRLCRSCVFSDGRYCNVLELNLSPGVDSRWGASPTHKDASL